MMHRTVICLFCLLLLLCPFTAARALSPTPSPTPDPEGRIPPAPTQNPALAPVITLTGGEELTVPAAFTFEDPGATAVDYLGQDMTGRITVTGQVIPYLVGEYHLFYRVRDDRGNTASIRRTVTVVPVELPEIVQPPEKTIYLTFDDGPSNNTEVLLDILKKYDVKATFFVVGERGRKDLIRRAYEEGHSIGVHSYTHSYEKIYSSEAAFFADFLATEEVIKAQTGQYTTIFRFPGGGGNTVSLVYRRGIMTRLTKIMEDMGYRYFDWTASAGDANEAAKTWSDTDFFSILCMKPKTDGSPTVILQHDLNGNSVRAVDLFIPWALERGYTFLPLDMTSPVFHSPVKN